MTRPARRGAHAGDRSERALENTGPRCLLSGSRHIFAYTVGKGWVVLKNEGRSKKISFQNSGGPAYFLPCGPPVFEEKDRGHKIKEKRRGRSSLLGFPMPGGPRRPPHRFLLRLFIANETVMCSRAANLFFLTSCYRFLLCLIYFVFFSPNHVCYWCLS